MVRSMVKVNYNNIEGYLNHKVKVHNKRFYDVEGKRADVETLKIVFSRGYFQAKHQGVEDEKQLLRWGIRRVRYFLYLLRIGYPTQISELYIQEDYELLPKDHRMYCGYQTFFNTEESFFGDTISNR